MMDFLRAPRHLMAWMCLVFVGAIAGCGGDEGGKIKIPPLGAVKGTIKLDDKPLPNASVQFLSDKSRIAAGETDANGVYTINYDPSHKGAVVGEHEVKIFTRKEAGTKEMIPAKYNEKTTLKATVKAGDNTIDFSLQSK